MAQHSENRRGSDPADELAGESPRPAVAPHRGRQLATPGQLARPEVSLDPNSQFDPALQECDSVSSVLDAVGQAAYTWTLKDDAMRWSGNVNTVLGVRDPVTVATGRGFAAFLNPDNLTSPYDTVFNGIQSDSGSGVPFQIEYKFRPLGRYGELEYCLEDSGRWFASVDGTPDRVLGVVRRVDERHARDQELRFLSSYDPLTGNMNRARLAEAVDQAIETCERHRMPCAFILAAIDNLALINDAYGFDIADEAIAKVAEGLLGQLRGGDAMGRYAGNKFGVLLSNCSDQDMDIAAERLLKSVRDAVISTSAGPVAATISLGGVALPRHAHNANEAMVRAEEALGQAKARYNSSFVPYQHSGRRESVRKRNILCADEIVSALDERRLAIVYQPIVEAATGAADIYECLLRVVKQGDIMMSAGSVIPVAEQIGLIRLIDHRVLELVFETMAESRDVTFSMNISVKTANDSVWLSNLAAFISANRNMAERLIVEITETVAINDIEESQKFVRAIRDLGCKVAIDDFGAGYTSFSNLKLLDVDIVKIDGSFIRALVNDPDDQVFVRTLVELAKNFGTKVVAECVEDDASADLLRQWGVDYLQGYHFGAAVLGRPWLDNASGEAAAV